MPLYTGNLTSLWCRISILKETELCKELSGAELLQHLFYSLLLLTGGEQPLGGRRGTRSASEGWGLAEKADIFNTAP